ncbi:MAG: hypothetical protein OEU51_07430 [Gammaproteobacteria bacterium]|jgi:hypothetical protein|nr:hypothetical protein [Gammaproteobacteria bacterium]
MRAVWLLVTLLLLVFVYIWFNPDYQEQLKQTVEELSSDAGITKKTTRVYKWRNTEGEWQITDHQPPDGVEYERLDYREDVNVLPLPPQLGGE